MATTSIWSVKGWLGRVVIYAENPEKTENPAYFEKQGMTAEQAQGLSDVIDYAAQSRKTQLSDERTEIMRRFVSGINCRVETTRDEMMAAKKGFGKEDGVVAYHGYQSFAPGEATPEMAHEIGVKLADKLWGEKYQVLVATHLDKANHLHNHFVVNTVSWIDGIRYHRTERDYYNMQKESDALCREYGLSVIEEPKRGKSKQYGEWQAECPCVRRFRRRQDMEGYIDKCPSYIHSLKQDGRNTLAEATIVKRLGDNDYLADYNGIQCHAMETHGV